jgi:hypothetical protein
MIQLVLFSGTSSSLQDRPQRDKEKEEIESQHSTLGRKLLRRGVVEVFTLNHFGLSIDFRAGISTLTAATSTRGHSMYVLGLDLTSTFLSPSACRHCRSERAL